MNGSGLFRKLWSTPFAEATPALVEGAPPCSDDPRFSSHTRRTPVKLTLSSRGRRAPPPSRSRPPQPASLSPCRAWPWPPQRSGRSGAAGQPDQRQPDPEHRPGQDGDQGLLRRHPPHGRPGPGLHRRTRRRPCTSSTRTVPTPTRSRASRPRPGSSWLTRRTTAEARPARPILFDIDDTTLNTYSYEIYSNFVFNPTTNANFVNAGPPRLPGRAGHGRPRAEGHGQGLHGVLPDRSPRDRSARHPRGQPDRRRLHVDRRQRVPEGQTARRSRGCSSCAPDLHDRRSTSR